MTLIHRDADDDAVAEHARAARDRATVAAAFADDGCGFAGDGRFIDAGDAFHDVAVSRDNVACLAHNEVALVQVRGRDLLLKAIAQASGDRILARFAQALGLGFTAALGDGFGEVGEEHGEPEPDRQLSDEPAFDGGAVSDADGRQRGANHRHKHDGVLQHQPRVELAERVADGGTGDGPIKE